MSLYEGKRRKTSFEGDSELGSYVTIDEGSDSKTKESKNSKDNNSS